MVGLLRCPHCHRTLTRGGPTWGCPAGHRFDVARQGFVTLLGRPTSHEGDTAAMLDARAEVLDAGHLDLVTSGLVDALQGPLPAGALVEVGAGTAHHLRGVCRAMPDRPAVAMDVSTAAVRRAARVAPELMEVVRADVWEAWPVRDRVAAAVLCVFGPRNPAETARVLVPEGLLVVATPAPDHLHELRDSLELLQVEAAKRDRLRDDVAAYLEPLHATELRERRRVPRDVAGAMAAMGPAGHHTAPDRLRARVAALPEEVDVTVAVHISRFRAPHDA